MVVKLARFFRYPAVVKLWFVPVWLALGVAKLAIFTVSFKRLVPRLGVSMGVSPWLPLLDAHQEQTARWIGQVIQMAARYTPWESNCFPQAVVARLLLGWYRIPYGVFFGVCRDPLTADFRAHAWVGSGRVRVTGGFGFSRYVVVGVFVAPQLLHNWE